MSVTFAPDGKTLASGSGDHTIRLWDAATGKELNKFDGLQGIFSSVAYSPGGKMLVSGGVDEAIRLWEVATGKELRKFEGCAGYVTSVAFSPDGMTLASGSTDWTMDGKRLASSHSNTTVLIWDVKSLLPVDSGTLKPLEILWDDLARDDVPRAFASIQTLGNGGSDAVHFIKSKLNKFPLDEDLAQRVRKAIGDLNHDDFDVREKAEKELLALGDAAGPTIQETVEKTGSAEVKMRGGRILEILQRPLPIPPGEPLRRWRAIQVLERIGSKEAREVLEMLEKKLPSLRERKETKAALERLSKRR